MFCFRILISIYSLDHFVQLTAPGRIAFDTAASLRSGKFHDWELYSFYRLAAHLEEPLRSQARRKMKQAFKFRNLTKPPMNSPLGIPFLAHFSFNQKTSRWLRDHILRYKDVAIPLHLPTAKLREAAFPTIRELLHNHRRAEKWWDLDNVDNLPCCCDWIREHSTHLISTTDHIACAFEDLSVPSYLRIFQSANANSTYFYSRQPFFVLFAQRVTSWTQRHGLPPFTDEEIRSFFDEQWLLHLQELTVTPRFTCHKIKHLQQWLPQEAILHHGDHEQAKLTVFCPRLYFQGAWNTWNDPELFRRLPLTYDEAQTTIERSIPSRIQKKYKWAINTNSALPYGFVFLKRKKQFKKGRTLISYFRSRYGRLLQVTARTIDSMLLQLWPQTMGQLAVPQIWQTVHRFLSDTSLDVNLHAVNDDLVGFFNSVPQDRLLDAVNSLILDRHPDTVLSVDMSQRGNPLQLSYVGKIHKAPKKTKVISPDDVFTIAQGSLSCHIFQAVNVIWQQIRGAGIGSQISPSLSNLAVTIVERSWTQVFKEVLDPPIFPFLAIRYVDNRYILFPEEKQNEPSIQVLSQDDFYQHPVELEEVTKSPSQIHSLILLYGAKGFSIPDCYRAIRKIQRGPLVPAIVPSCVSQTLLQR